MGPRPRVPLRVEHRTNAGGHYHLHEKRQPPTQEVPAIIAGMNFGNALRVVVVTGACFAAVGSAPSNQNQTQQQASPQYGQSSPPPPQQMDPARSLGLWKSTFGAVKIEGDNSRGGLGAGALQGVWEYTRQG